MTAATDAGDSMPAPRPLAAGAPNPTGHPAPAPHPAAGQRYRAPARLIGGQFQIESRAPVIILTALTLLLTSLTFPPVGWWPLAYFCLTPWLVSVCTVERSRWVYVASYLLGFGYFFINVRWLAPVTLPGYLALCVFFALFFPLAAWPLRHMFRRHGASIAIALPLVWTAAEYIRSLTLVGFPWLLLAHTHYRVLPMIQIADLVGAYGVSFVIAMINGWLTDLLIQPILIWRLERPERTTRLPIGSLSTFVVVTATLVYGSADRTRGPAEPAPGREGPLVAVIQHDFPMFVDADRARRTPPEIIFSSYMALVERAAAERPDLLVLPETPWPGYFNDEFILADSEYLEAIRKREFPNYSPGAIESVRAWCRETRDALLQVARHHDVVIVTGSASIEWKPTEIPPRVEKYNSAFLLSPSRNAPPQRYDKVHLVLFGEFVPFRYGPLHWLYKWLNGITPWGAGGVEYSLTAGRSFRPLEFAARSQPGRRYRAGTPICYEDTVPYVARRFAAPRGLAAAAGPEGKGIDLLLNISNDGWFAHSAELEQHLAASVFRAVENRVGVARSVNTGASAMIEPGGRIHDRVELRPDQLARMPEVRVALEKVRTETLRALAAESSVRPDLRGAFDAVERSLRPALAPLGNEFAFLPERLIRLLAELRHAAASGGAAPDARQAAEADLLEQIADDLDSVERWRARPWTAPGYRLARVRVDPRETIYTRWGDWFSTGCALLLGVMIVDWLMFRLRSKSRPATRLGPRGAGPSSAAGGR